MEKITINGVEYILTPVENKTVNKIEPKFKVGDEIKTANEESLTITKIDEKGYWSKDLFICSFDEECIWDLVEQKPTDKVETKFKKGDRLVHNERKHIIKVVNPTPLVYEVVDILGYHHTITDTAIENNYHLWTIQDAKKGDILFQDLMGGKTFIYNGVNPNMAILYSFIISNDGEDVLPYHIGKPNTGIGNIEENKNIIHPATKEQRGLLFQKMHEAGYEWDDEKKELKNIREQHLISNYFNAEYERGKVDALKSTTWSEEDEEHLNSIIDDIKTNMGAYPRSQEVIDIYNDDISFLKSLKDRVQPQPKQEWSEEDDYNLQCMIAKVSSDIQNGNVGRNNELINWLKSIKNRIQQAL